MYINCYHLPYINCDYRLVFGLNLCSFEIFVQYIHAVASVNHSGKNKFAVDSSSHGYSIQGMSTLSEM